MNLHFSEVLQPGNIHPGLGAATQEDAVHALLESLRGDERVQDFEALETAVRERNAPAIVQDGAGLCIAHGRTNSLTSLVMAAGILAEPPLLTGELRGRGSLRLVIVAGIPSCLNADYLRLVGAIARIFSQETMRSRLLAATTAGDFLEILEEGLNPI